MTFQIRQLSPADYPLVISVIDQWWGGRPMAGKLPRLFFEHFTDTSFAAERGGRLAGFLAGFISQSRPGEAYIHFVGVDPAERGGGLGRASGRPESAWTGGRGYACAATHSGTFAPSPDRWVTPARPRHPLRRTILSADGHRRLGPCLFT